MWLSILLIRSGDIHVNPGPAGHDNSMNSSSSSLSSFINIDYSKYLTIIHHNVQSLFPKIDEIYAEFKEIDILSFSETWLSDNVHSDDLHLTDFHSPERKDRVSNRYGGVIVYVKSNINYTRRLDLEPDGLECIWIDLLLKKKHVLFGTFYRPPSSGRQCLSSIENSVQLAVDTGISDIIITGDFNYDMLKPSSSRVVSSLCQQFGLKQIIDEPTHFTENSSSLIDIFLISNDSSLISSGVGDPYLNQNVRYHCPIYSTFNYLKPKCMAIERKIWKYDNGNYILLKQKAENTNWIEFENANINEFNRDILNKLNRITQECIPNKVIKLRPSEPPWLNAEIKRSIRKRKRAYRKAKIKNTAYLWEKFRKLRNDTTSLIRQCKKSHNENLALKLKTTELLSKDWWKTMKSFITHNVQSQIPALNYENRTATESCEKADLLNKYFAAQSMLNEQNSNVPHVNPSNTAMPFFTITPDEVASVLKSLPLGKASGPDEVNNKILRELADILCVPLCSLFNKSLTEGLVPSAWKEAHVCAIFKKGDPSQVSNYRPVSLLSNIDKVMERIIFKHIYNFLRDTDFLTSFQSGFVPGDSTVNQLTFMYNSFCKALDEGKEIRVVFFDISKAFDRVWHRGLLAKLKGAGIDVKLLSWLKNYLTDRKQRVVIPGGKSDWLYIKAGVPQGSILGPLMFLVYINDIVKDIQSNIRLFADDTSLYLIVDHPDLAATTLQNDISRITEWAENWLVKFNPSKTESLLISRKVNKPLHPTLSMLNEDIIEVDMHKHLGVILSNDGSWHNHINIIKEKAWKRINLMRKLKYKLDRKSLEVMYVSFIRPILEYANVIWDNCTAYEKDDLEKIQIEAARIVTGCTKLVSLRDLYNETKWDTLDTRRTNQKLLLMYKMSNNSTPEYMSSLVPRLVNETTRYSLRNANNIRPVQTRTQLYSNSFLPSVITEWNKLSEDVRASPSLSSFKSSISSKNKVPAYYFSGHRKGQILHTRLRTNCSGLKLCLFQKNIVDSPLCTCGEVESTDHFMLRCRNYQLLRNELLDTIRSMCTVSTEILLFGNPNLSETDNIYIFTAVQKYIIQTKRFEREP